MKIYIDINHPAHVHYFRNLIKTMEKEEHTFIVSNRNDGMINSLLDLYGISHHIRCSRPKKRSSFRSLLYLISGIMFCIKLSLKLRPDFFLGFASAGCSISSFILRKPCVLINDTEHNKLAHHIYYPFCSVLLTPFYFFINLGKKQMYYNAYVEQFYIYKNSFVSDLSIFKDLGINDNESYGLFRFIAYDAAHDSAVKPISIEEKKLLVKKAAQKIKVFVSMEHAMADEFFDQYAIKISPDKMHSVIANSSFFITEGATMAAEAGLLGVPYMYINPLQNVGNIKQQVMDYPTIAHSSIDFNQINDFLDLTLDGKIKKSELISLNDNTINPTKFLKWFIEDYPNSIRIIRENPDYQYRFK